MRACLALFTVFCFAVTVVPASAAPDLNNGLILYYSFNQDEGGIVTDDSGNGRTATVDGATHVENGICGGAYHFDGIDDSIVADDAGLPIGDSPRSVSYWFTLDALKPNGITLAVEYGPRIVNRLYSLGVDWRIDRDLIYFTSCGPDVFSDERVQPSTWYHVVHTYAGSGVHRIYINGRDTGVRSGITVNTLLAGTLRIGNSFYEMPHNGIIDELRIYNRVLSFEEAQVLYGPLCDGPGPPPSEEWITRIGFSNAPDGEQDVTEFLPDETLYICVRDVDTNIEDPKSRVSVVMAGARTSAKGKKKKMRAVIELTPQEDGSYTGSVPLADFAPGAIVIHVSARSPRDGLVLQRKARIYVRDDL